VDDTIIFSSSAEEYLQHLDQIIHLFHERNLAISLGEDWIGYPSGQALGPHFNAFSITPAAERLSSLTHTHSILLYGNPISAVSHVARQVGYKKDETPKLLIPIYIPLI
jgi:hypothetical protein